MSTYDLLKNLTLFGLAHVALITLVTEGIKRIASVVATEPSKPIKVLIPVALGVTSLWVARAVVRGLGLTEFVCADVEKCVEETLLVCGMWWAGASSGSIGMYHILKLLWVDIILATKNKLKSWGAQ